MTCTRSYKLLYPRGNDSVAGPSSKCAGYRCSNSSVTCVRNSVEAGIAKEDYKCGLSGIVSV